MCFLFFPAIIFWLLLRVLVLISTSFEGEGAHEVQSHQRKIFVCAGSMHNRHSASTPVSNMVGVKDDCERPQALQALRTYQTMALSPVRDECIATQACIDILLQFPSSASSRTRSSSPRIAAAASVLRFLRCCCYCSRRLAPLDVDLKEQR